MHVIKSLAEEATAVGIPKPRAFEDTTIPSLPPTPNYDSIPGYDEFDDAIKFLRTALDITNSPRFKNILPAHVRQIELLLVSAIRQINFGLKTIYNSLPPEMLSEASEKLNYKIAQQNKPTVSDPRQSLIGNINYLYYLASNMKSLFERDKSLNRNKLNIIIENVANIKRTVEEIKQVVGRLSSR